MSSTFAQTVRKVCGFSVSPRVTRFGKPSLAGIPATQSVKLVAVDKIGITPAAAFNAAFLLFLVNIALRALMGLPLLFASKVKS